MQSNLRMAVRMLLWAASIFLLVSCDQLMPTKHHTIYEAVAAGDVNDVRRHIIKQHPIDMKDDSGATALHIAALRDDTTMLGLLLRAGAELNAEDNKGRLAIGYAAIRGHA